MSSESTSSRSIPAYAEEPWIGFPLPDTNAVYPRVCGGTQPGLILLQPVTGLSPRMRGNLPGRATAAAISGSIPAYAGEPKSCKSWQSGAKVYPRVCGGTVILKKWRVRMEGLSPRMRGNPVCGGKPGLQRRSIPAYAGEPTAAQPLHTAPSVYPRVCGGTPVARLSRHRPPGLSPRMRGNPIAALVVLLVCRSIPAYAGEPPPGPAAVRLRQVYPRVCGGTRNPDTLAHIAAGLSPRMRGNPATHPISGP